MPEAYGSICIASRVFNSSVRIIELVDGVFNPTHARFGMKMNVHTADISMVAEKVIEEIRAAYPDRQIALSVSGELQGDWNTGRLCQIIFNLVSNALQYGSPIHPVAVSLDEDDESVAFRAHNFGALIPEHEMGHIVEPMRRYAHLTESAQGALSIWAGVVHCIRIRTCSWRHDSSQLQQGSRYLLRGPYSESELKPGQLFSEVSQQNP